MPQYEAKDVACFLLGRIHRCHVRMALLPSLARVGSNRPNVRLAGSGFGKSAPPPSWASLTAPRTRKTQSRHASYMRHGPSAPAGEAAAAREREEDIYCGEGRRLKVELRLRRILAAPRRWR